MAFDFWLEKPLHKALLHLGKNATALKSKFVLNKKSIQNLNTGQIPGCGIPNKGGEKEKNL